MTLLKKILHKIYSAENILEPKDIRGEIPDDRTIYNKALKIIWPSATESVLIGFVAMIDTIMVGGIGPEAIAAVGLTIQPKFIFLALIFAINAGATTVVARRKGEGDIEGANCCLRQSIMITAAISLILTVLGIVYAKQLVIISGANYETVADATVYLQLIMAGFFFMSLGLTINAAQKGVGNTKISMKTNLVANCINLIFNYFLIEGHCGFPRMGVAGAALATTLGYTVAFGMSVFSVWNRHEFLNVSIHDHWKFDKKTVRGIYNIASSAVVEQMFMRIGFFTYARLVAGLGTIAFATHQICMNVVNISFTLGDGFNVAVASLTGQSLGAKRDDMAKVYVSVSKKIVKTITYLIAIFFIIFRLQIIQMFSTNAQIIEMGGQIMFIIAGVTLIQSSALVYSGCLRGAGDAKYIAWVAFISIAIVRPISAWILCYPVGLGLFGAWISFLLDQMLRWILTGIRFKNGQWSKIVV